MSKNNIVLWPNGRLIVLSVLLNAIIVITASFYNPALFWMLSVTVPLLIFGIYSHVRQIYLTSGKHRIISLQEAAKQGKYELLSHSVHSWIDETDLKVRIGNEQCSLPYDACLFNIGTRNNIHPGKPLDQGTKNERSDISKYSSQEKLRTYCLAGKDLVWQIGPNNIGCRDENGHFNSKLFIEVVRQPQIKMIELMLSTATPRRSTDSSFNIDNGTETKISGNTFTGPSNPWFAGPEGMIHFLDSLRQLSGGKPVGIRLCINNKKEFHEICYAIRKTHLIPDFITVEGSFEVITSPHASEEFDIGMPLYEAVLFVSQTLRVYGLEKEIKIIAAGEIPSCCDILKVLALGANVVCAELHDDGTIRYIDNDGKPFFLSRSQNLHVLQDNLMKAVIRYMNLCGFMNVSDITLSNIFRKLEAIQIVTPEKLYVPDINRGSVRKFYKSILNAIA